MSILKSSQSDVRSVTSLGRPQDINLIKIHKIGFQENFSLLRGSKCISDHGTIIRDLFQYYSWYYSSMIRH